MVHGGDSVVDLGVEMVDRDKGLVGEMVALEVTPGALDVIEFGGVSRQPLDGQPGPRGKRSGGGAAGVDRAVVEHQDGWLGRGARRRCELAIEPREQADEVGTALGGAGLDHQAAGGNVERPQQGAPACLPRRRDAEVGATLGPGMGEVGVGQGLELVAEQNPDVAGPRLLPQQPEPQAGPLDRLRVLAAFQAVARPAPGEAPFCRAGCSAVRARSSARPAARSPP